ncbi:hypothetical protein E4U42_007702 [Claviceps africana]|uniref:Uncharacterized protein n=1 Tax=Claviceps africana TaxID=83212 RepID=A0A8K0NIP0_9HYPO|nr:hypothetical protein E4U42_007702 [Claviceps africana]
MSQVKNLRAMFENKGDSISPDRGRSPGSALSRNRDDGISPGGSPRPLSKVRTNFVAVERDGRIGLRRDESGDSSTSARRPCSDAASGQRNNSRDQERVATSSDDITSISTKDFSLPDTAVNATITPGEVVVDAPITPGEDAAAAEDDETNIPETTKTQSTSEPDVVVHDESMAELCSPPKAEETKMGNKSNGHANADLDASLSTATAIDHNTGANSAPSVTPKSSTKESKATTRKPKESKAVREESKVVSTAMGPSLRAKSTPVSSGAPRNRQPVGVKHQTSTNLEHKPKSVTEPVRLPSSLIAPTASSASKVHDSQSSHQTRPGTKSSTSASLPSSTKSGSSTLSSHTVTQRRASSSRPSLGPPPKKPLPPAATSKKLSNVDESFLARLTRPTRSSASKSADKVSAAPQRGSSQPVAERKDSGPSDRGSAPSRSSRLSPVCRPSTMEVPAHETRAIIEGAQAVEVLECSKDTTKNDNHKNQGTLVDAPEATAQKHAIEATAPIILVDGSVSGTSTTHTIRDSSETEQVEDGVKSRKQSSAPDMEPISASKDTESQLCGTSESKSLEASVLSSDPGMAAGDRCDVLSPDNDQKSSPDDVFEPQANSGNIKVEEDSYESLINAVPTTSEGKSLESQPLKES